MATNLRGETLRHLDTKIFKPNYFEKIVNLPQATLNWGLSKLYQTLVIFVSDYLLTPILFAVCFSRW